MKVKNLNQEMLNEMSNDELLTLIEIAKNILADRKCKENKEFTFEFNASEDKRKGVPYAAKITLKDNKFEREFYQFDRVYDGKYICVSGTYTAKAGDIIEIRASASWKNDHRYMYLINETGEKVKIGHSKTDCVFDIKKYLAGEMTAEELINKYNK